MKRKTRYTKCLNCSKLLKINKWGRPNKYCNDNNGKCQKEYIKFLKEQSPKPKIIVRRTWRKKNREHIRNYDKKYKETLKEISLYDNKEVIVLRERISNTNSILAGLFILVTIWFVLYLIFFYWR